ncbi:mCG1048882, partial [Mus musculus]
DTSHAMLMQGWQSISQDITGKSPGKTEEFMGWLTAQMWLHLQTLHLQTSPVWDLQSSFFLEGFLLPLILWEKEYCFKFQ